MHWKGHKIGSSLSSFQIFLFWLHIMVFQHNVFQSFIRIILFHHISLNSSGPTTKDVRGLFGCYFLWLWRQMKSWYSRVKKMFLCPKTYMHDIVLHTQPRASSFKYRLCITQHHLFDKFSMYLSAKPVPWHLYTKNEWTNRKAVAT